jgi:hypothetical protein
MRLNGWQRLWVVLSAVWMILTAMLTSTTWPPTILSLDPSAGIPVGSDVTYLMDGVLAADEKVTSSEFARRLKAKYPEYLDLSDETLVNRTLTRYPYYRQFMSDLNAFDQSAPSADEVNAANRREAVVHGALLALIPPLGVYVLGIAIAWIRRGFRAL